MIDKTVEWGGHPCPMNTLLHCDSFPKAVTLFLIRMVPKTVYLKNLKYWENIIEIFYGVG
jgi:hypothetical protein